MPHTFQDHHASINDIQLHFIEYKNHHAPLLLLHGLTANAHAFHGLIEAGLTQHFSVISLDQRGRGLSTKTAFSYTIEDHALDVIGLLDHLKIDSIRICGHSFGGLVATYLAYHYPERFEQVVILDAAPKMNPNTPEMLKATLSRIDAHYKNFDTYLSTVKQAPFLTFWDDAMLEYYKADVATAADGTVEPRSNLADIAQIAYHVSQEPWDIYFSEMEQPSILINAVEDYTLSQPLLPDFLAKEAVGRMKQSQYKAVNGNHQTMLFGEPAKEVLQQMQTFLLKDTHQDFKSH